TCACLRRAWHLLSEEGQKCVETVEDFADGKVSKQQLEAVRVLYVRGGNQADNGAYYAASPVAQFRSFASSALSHARLAVGEQGFSVTLQPVDWERAHQLELARDILGNPFRPATIDPSWLGWNNGVVGKIAQAIYDERAFERMPVLADALED